MKAPSTTTTVAGKSHHVSVRRVAPGMTSPLWLPKARLSMRLVPRVLLHAVQVEIATVTVVDDHGREPLDLEPADRFGAEILVGDHLELLHESREYGPRPADRGSVRGRRPWWAPPATFSTKAESPPPAPPMAPK